MNLAKLIQQYHDVSNSASERDLGGKEREIWNLAKRQPGFKADRKTWLRKELGCGNHQNQTRFSLLKMGVLAEPFWQRLDSGSMTIAQAENILRGVKKYSRETDMSLVSVIETTMKKFDSAAPGQGEDSALKSVKGKTKTRGTRVQTRKFRDAISEASDKYIQFRLGDVDQGSVKAGKVMLLIEIEEAIANFHVFVDKRARKIDVEARHTAKMSHWKIVEACEVLGVDPPDPGFLPDMDLARSKKRSAVRKYHPDISQTEAHREKYEAVILAFDVLQEHETVLNG